MLGIEIIRIISSYCIFTKDENRKRSILSQLPEIFCLQATMAYQTATLLYASTRIGQWFRNVASEVMSNPILSLFLPWWLGSAWKSVAKAIVCNRATEGAILICASGWWRNESKLRKARSAPWKRDGQGSWLHISENWRVSELYQNRWIVSTRFARQFRFMVQNRGKRFWPRLIWKELTSLAGEKWLMLPEILAKGTCMRRKGWNPERYFSVTLERRFSFSASSQVIRLSLSGPRWRPLASRDVQA